MRRIKRFLHFETLSASVSFSIATRAEAAKPASLHLPAIGPVDICGRTSFPACLLVHIQCLQRLYDFVVGDRFIRARIETKGWDRLDGEDIGCPRSENGPLFLLANVVIGKHVTRVTEMPGRMKQ